MVQDNSWTMQPFQNYLKRLKIMTTNTQELILPTSTKDIEKLKRNLVLQKVSPKDFALLAHDLQIISNINDQTLQDTKLTAYIQANNINNYIIQL